MPSRAESYAHLFPERRRFSELPLVSSPLSVLALPLMELKRRRYLTQFKQSFQDSSLFLKRIDLPFPDRLQFFPYLAGLEPVRRYSREFAPFLVSLLEPHESLGGVCSQCVEGLYILTVIGVLKELDPQGFIWVKTGNIPRVIYGRRLAQAV